MMKRLLASHACRYLFTTLVEGSVPMIVPPVGWPGTAQALLLEVLTGGMLGWSAALIVAGRAKDLKEGVALGSKSLDSGAAAARLKHLIAVSNA